MATHDYVIANASGAAVRADLNNALAAIVSNNSNATEPATTYAYMWWADTTNGQLKLRNAANDAWITIQELDGTMLLEDGSAAAPGLAFTSDLDTGLYLAAANSLGFATDGTARAVIDSSGRLLLGTSSSINVGSATAADIQVASAAGFISQTRYVNNTAGSALILAKSRSTTPGSYSIVSNADDLGSIIFAGDDGTDVRSIAASILAEVDGTPGVNDMPGCLVFSTTADGDSSPTERARIDSSGRLLVGTSTDLGQGESQFKSHIHVFRTSDSTAAGQSVGIISFGDTRGGAYAQIQALSDATPGTNDYPGRLVFATTADGDNSPTERARITNSGAFLIGKTSNTDNTTEGFIFEAGTLIATRGTDRPLVVNRQTNDGSLVSLRQANTEEGTISVSGTTVSYNGAHLSRWSQLPGGAERIEILRGSVLSNIDEMCEWGEEENEQLNRMKVSDVEGDKNVSGVFQDWDDDDDTYTNDFYCAMTGDFIIRIAEGVTVERGDLLMSAGDGTAKPQDDDIIRSKTIAKVTSINVSCTYDDGSYCVPCVLMAC